MKGSNPDCPCGSGARYAACCRPFHRGEQVAPDPERLMRSRFSAYALGEAPYLYMSLDPEHPDRARPEAEVVAQIRAARARINYVRLRVLEAPPPGDSTEGFVLFHAELYEKGKEASFTELSRFRKHAGVWRYHSGQLVPMKAGDPALKALTIATFVPAA